MTRYFRLTLYSARRDLRQSVRMHTAPAFLKSTEVEEGGTHPQFYCSTWGIKWTLFWLFHWTVVWQHFIYQSRHGELHEQVTSGQQCCWKMASSLEHIRKQTTPSTKNLVETLENDAEKSDMKLSKFRRSKKEKYTLVDTLNNNKLKYKICRVFQQSVT